MTQDWQALAREIRDRRDQLGLTQEQVAARGGPSTATMRMLEGALQQSYRHRTFADLDRALDWPAGHSRAVLNGAVSVAVGAPPAASTAEQDEDPIIAAIEASDRLLPEAKEHFLNQYRLLLRIGGPAGVRDRDVIRSTRPSRQHDPGSGRDVTRPGDPA